MQENQPDFTNIDEYIAGFPPDIQRLLQQMRRTIHDAAPDAEEAISYQMPTFRLQGNLVHFAAFKSHIGFYPSSSGIERFKDEFTPYKWSKGAVQFPFDQPIPHDLVRRIVLFRVEENLSRAAAKASTAAAAVAAAKAKKNIN